MQKRGEIEFLSDRRATIAGINIGGTNTTVVGGLEDGTILARWTAPTPADDGELLIAQTSSKRCSSRAGRAQASASPSAVR